MAFDTERFISEIECRRAIWDISSEEYSNRDAKRNQWEEIVNSFGGQELDITAKKELGKAYFYYSDYLCIFINIFIVSHAY